MLGKKTNSRQFFGTIARNWKVLASTHKFTSFFSIACFALIFSTIPVLSSPSTASAISQEQCSQLGGTVQPGTGKVCSFTKAQLSKADCSANGGTPREKSNPSGVKEYNGCQIALSGSTAGSSIQTSAECNAAGGIWQADGNFEGPGEMGTCILTGGGTIDPSIKTKAACDEAEGVWKADGNNEGPGEVGTCTILQTSVDGIEGEEEEQLSCQIEGIGWIVCPVFNAIGSLTDASYSVVERLLITPSSMFSTSDTTGSFSALKGAWEAVRNIANVAFVIAFLIIIYSQLTGRGLGNYGVKKMLPRLIVSAILVNASFWVGALAVDISNVTGASVSGFFSGLSNNIADAGVGDTAWHESSDALTTFWGTIIATVLAGAAVGALWGSLAVLGPILVIAAFAILTVVIVLTLRQALIVLLLVVSPLAFVAFLLPNTEGLFKKWMNLFIVLLAMFPAIALIFSVSKLAGAIVMASSDDMLVQIAGAGMTIIPLFITPIVMRTAGATLGRITGTMDIGAKKGLLGRSRKLRDEQRGRVRDTRAASRLKRGEKIIGGKDGKFLGGSSSARRRVLGSVASLGATNAVNRNEAINNAKSARQDASQEYLSDRLSREGDVLAEKLAANEGQEQGIRARAAAIVDKQSSEEVGEREVLLRAKFKDPRKTVDGALKELDAAITSNDAIGARAAQNVLLNSGSYGVSKLQSKLIKMEDSGSLSASGDTSAALRRDLAKAGLKGKDAALNEWAIKSGASLSQAAKAASTYEGLSDKELVGQTTDNLENMKDTGAIDPMRAKAMLENPSLASDFTKKKREVFSEIAAQAPRQPATSNRPNQQQSNDGTLSIPHSGTPNQSIDQTPITAKQAAPAPSAVPNSPANAVTPGTPQVVQQASGWAQTDSGLSIPRSNPTAVQQAPQSAAVPSSVQQQTQPAAAAAPQPQAAPAAPAPAPVPTQPTAPAAPAQQVYEQAEPFFKVNDRRAPRMPKSTPAAPDQPINPTPEQGSHTDATGRLTPNSAPADYHDRMSR